MIGGKPETSRTAANVSKVPVGLRADSSSNL